MKYLLYSSVFSIRLVFGVPVKFECRLFCYVVSIRTSEVTFSATLHIARRQLGKTRERLIFVIKD